MLAIPFDVVRNDITNMTVDAIVNPANPRPVIGSGTDSRIHEKAGPELLTARQEIGRKDSEICKWANLSKQHSSKIRNNPDYKPNKSTAIALPDAVGGTIHHIGNVHRYAREEDHPEKTLFVITTDGMENASRRHSCEKVREMITRQKEKHGWEFLLLGANIDAAREVARFDIGADRAANYHADTVGTGVIYEVVCDTVRDFRASRPVGAGWEKRIDEEFGKRGG